MDNQQNASLLSSPISATVLAGLWVGVVLAVSVPVLADDNKTERAACVEACGEIATAIVEATEKEELSNREGIVKSEEAPVFRIETLDDTEAVSSVLKACVIACLDALE